MKPEDGGPGGVGEPLNRRGLLFWFKNTLAWWLDKTIPSTHSDLGGFVVFFRLKGDGSSSGQAAKLWQTALAASY